MSVQMLFVISSPRSGSTMLEQILESHSSILGGPEPHLLTPLAHLGFWAKVDRAPYDPEAAADALRRFVEELPGKEGDYWAACRAYSDVLYGQYLAGSGKSICLDKTPAYALVLPFLAKVFPDAKYVVLARHPIATFSSYANSFFDGDYQAAHRYNPLLNRYVPAIASFLRRGSPPGFHIRYEDLVLEPELWLERIYAYIGVPFERETIDYGRSRENAPKKRGLGDPIGVRQYTRPSTQSLHKWVLELSADSAKRSFMEEIIGSLDPGDLQTLGYPTEEVWKPLANAPSDVTPQTTRLTQYRLQRKIIVGVRAVAQRQRILRRSLESVRAICATLMNE
ncbi:MAG: sulfotransferase [Candidatus Hydrogenedentes bacterium]|nr:sulfotransferase [Candidatus Hydrogenedentota bacterium]